MDTVPTERPRCKGLMQAGLVINRGHAGALAQQQWMEGAAVPTIWYGLQVKGRARFNVMTYRCENCGYLESYATKHAQ